MTRTSVKSGPAVARGRFLQHCIAAGGRGFQWAYAANKLRELLAKDGAEAALGHCLDALAQSPAEAALHHVHGRALNNLDRLPEALDALNRAIGIESGNPQMFAHRGHILFRLQQRDEAVEDFHSALALEPVQLVALGGLAGIWLAAGQAAKAATLLVRLTACEPDNRKHWLNLGLARHESGLLHEAEEAFRNALELLPGDPDVCCGLASVLQSQGRLDEASEWFARALQLQPDHPQATAAIAGIHEMQGKTGAAMAMLRPLLAGNTGEVAPAGGLAGRLAVLEAVDEESVGRQAEGVPAGGVGKLALGVLGQTNEIGRVGCLMLAWPLQEVQALLSSAGVAVFDETDPAEGEPGFGEFEFILRNLGAIISDVSDVPQLVSDFWTNYTEKAARSGGLLALSDLLDGRCVDIGSGFLPAGAIFEEREKAKHRLQIDGHFATPGRLIARTMVEPGTQAWQLQSGAWDFLLNVADPVNIGLLKLGLERPVT